MQDRVSLTCEEQDARGQEGNWGALGFKPVPGTWKNLTGFFVMYAVQITSIPHFYFKAVSLKQLLRVGKTRGTHIRRTGEGMGSLQLP